MAAIIFGRSNKTEQYDLFTTLPNSDPTTDIIVKYFPEQKNMKLDEFFAPGVTFFDERAAAVAKWLSTHLAIKSLLVRVRPGAELFLSFFLLVSTISIRSIV